MQKARSRYRFFKPKMTIPLIVLLFLVGVFAVNSSSIEHSVRQTEAKPLAAKQANLDWTTPYTDPRHFTSLPFGYQSHWLQPWRAYLETVPATTFVDGTGINFNVPNTANPELVARMLSQQGIRRARVEINWGRVNFKDETKLNGAAEIRDRLLALKKYGIRPLILLNAHQGAPCPVKFSERIVTLDARAGATQLQLQDTRGLQVDYSGLSNLTTYWAGEVLFTEINGNTVTLSKPLPKPLRAGARVRVATLKYRPFSPPNSQDYQQTMVGWQRYVGTVAQFVAETLGTTNSSDKGFDLEIWNELTFGSNFLYINKYYDQVIYNYDKNSIWDNLVAVTANYIKTYPSAFKGVLVGNGFSNTIPWPAAAQQPPQIHAISKHPYTFRKRYPEDEFKNKPVNALFQPELKSNFVPPTYTAHFPEYYGTALQTETLVRDMGPITTTIQGKNHGRYARTDLRRGGATPVWITEVNFSPGQDDPNISAERALAIKAKTTARYFCFYLNKGVTQLHLYAVKGTDRKLGIVTERFQDYVEQPGAVYPTDDSTYLSPALATLGRMVAKMREQADPTLTRTRQLAVLAVGDDHGHYQFLGDGTAAHPNLFNRDVFAFLPFQVNARRFVIPYYVMTRDVMQDLSPEQFTVQIRGINPTGATITAYDPINDRIVPVTVEPQQSDVLSLKLTATDYPYLLTIQEE